MVAQLLMAASAAVILLLGLLHLVYTFRGPKFNPRDPTLQARMAEVSPVITRETTMWKCWVGFNASHSLGAILFGVIYGYLAIAHAAMLVHSPFLLLTGLVTLGSYAVLGRLYWFSVPFRGICLSLLCYAASIAVMVLT